MDSLRGGYKEVLLQSKIKAPQPNRPGRDGPSIADVNAARSEVSPDSTVARVPHDVDAAAEEASAMEVTTEMAAAETSAAHMNAATTPTEVRTESECGGRHRSDRERSDGDESELAKHFNLHV
jgi:hypothetical protein